MYLNILNLTFITFGIYARIYGFKPLTESRDILVVCLILLSSVGFIKYRHLEDEYNIHNLMLKRSEY